MGIIKDVSDLRNNIVKHLSGDLNDAIYGFENFKITAFNFSWKIKSFILNQLKINLKTLFYKKVQHLQMQ